MTVTKHLDIICHCYCSTVLEEGEQSRAEEKGFDETKEEAENIPEMDRILGVRYSFKKDTFLFYAKPEKVILLTALAYY